MKVLLRLLQLVDLPLKARDSGGRGAEIGLYINRELAVIAELAHPNTVELMRRLGHLPTAAPLAPPAP